MVYKEAATGITWLIPSRSAMNSPISLKTSLSTSLGFKFLARPNDNINKQTMTRAVRAFNLNLDRRKLTIFSSPNPRKTNEGSTKGTKNRLDMNQVCNT